MSSSWSKEHRCAINCNIGSEHHGRAIVALRTYGEAFFLSRTRFSKQDPALNPALDSASVFVALRARNATMSSAASRHRSPVAACQRLHVGQPVRRGDLRSQRRSLLVYVVVDDHETAFGSRWTRGLFGDADRRKQCRRQDRAHLRWNDDIQ